MCDEIEGYNLNEKSYTRHLAKFLQNMNLVKSFISVTMWIRILSSFMINFAKGTKNSSLSKVTSDLEVFQSKKTIFPSIEGMQILEF
jgi:ABC-type polysaccharide transport system permease subunit